MTFSLSVPAFAFGDSSAGFGGSFNSTGFWDWGLSRGSGFGGSFGVRGTTFGKSCLSSSSPDGYHHSDSMGHIGGTDNNGRYTICTCKYCGNTYRVYKSDLQQAYNDAVGAMENDIGTPVVTSSNALLWSPGHDYTLVATVGTGKNGVFCPHYEGDSLSGPSVDFNCANNSPNFFASPAEGETYFTAYSYTFNYSGVAPVSGTYRLLAGRASALTYNPRYGNEATVSYDYSAETSGTSYTKGATVSCTHATSTLMTSGFTQITQFKSYYAQGYAPVYEVIPASELLPTIQNNYNIQSRLNSFNGEFGIIGDNGEITKIDNQYIVNETDNSVYNPVTNTTNTFQSWSYDYSSRTYNVTYDNGTTAVITYGDEYVTINEGDTIYNVYYLISEGSGSGPVNPGPGDSSGTGSDDSSGIWKKLGELIGTVLGGIIEVLESVVSKLLDALVSLAEMLRSGIVDVVTTILSIFGEVPALFSGFLDFLGLMFPFLPPEMVTLITFGIAAVVFIGIIKAIRR